MMRIQRLFPLYLSVFLLLPANAPAGAVVEFSADVLQTIPEQPDMHGKIFVGKDRMRTEFKIDGRTMIQIVDTEKQLAFMLNSADRGYMKRKTGPGDNPRGSGTIQADNPCAGMPGTTCKKLGSEEFNGRMADKWEFESTAEGQSAKMLYWLDRERLIPLKQMMPDGTNIEMRLVGKEKINGRATEKWEISIQRIGRQSRVSHQWFDPELNTILRDEQAGGYKRELSNIIIGPQPAELFSVPAGHEEISASETTFQGEGSYR